MKKQAYERSFSCLTVRSSPLFGRNDAQEDKRRFDIQQPTKVLQHFFLEQNVEDEKPDTLQVLCVKSLLNTIEHFNMRLHDFLQ